MKNLILTVLVIASSFMYFGCDDALNINVDPLAATSANGDLLFTEVLVNLSNNRTIETTGRTAAIVQYVEPAFGVFGDMALGELGNTFLVGNVWSNLYSIGLKNLDLVEQDAAAAEPPNNNIVAQSQILQGFIYYILVNLWEDIPFSEAVNADFPTPGYDDQETVLRGLVTQMDAAVALIDRSEDAIRVTSGDLVFGGNMGNWERFANSIKLKALMLLANKDQSVASQIAETMTQPLIDELEFEAEFQYYDAPGDYNPIWNTLNRFSGGSNPEWWIGSTTLQGVLEELNDPRISTYYDESDEPDVVGSGEFRPGASPGSFGDCGDCSVVSLNILRPDFPDRYVIASSINLLQAEAIARGFAPGGMAAADAMYRKAIMQSMDYYDNKPGAIAPAEKEGYINSLAPLESLSGADALRAIHIQLYLSNFWRMPEGWTQWRRTKVPDLVVPQNSQLTDVIRRFFYPPDEKGANPNTPTDPPLESPMWYEN
ncbi:MAG: SusD/RagB family nutrient-binding outer membrane lipoprotein [Bacteroidota bacterium]